MAFNRTLFSQILSLIPPGIMQSLAKKHHTGRSTRQFGFKEQFTVMAFIQLAARSSLRDGLRCLTAASRYLYHWGLKQVVARSTVCDANRDRPFEFFKDLLDHMYKMCRAQAPTHKFRFNSKLFSIDSSTISLCMSVFPWATFRSKKAGIKLHTLLDHDGYIPAFVDVTEASTHDSQFVKILDLPKGSIVVFDRAYNDCLWLNSLNKNGIFFVGRLKSNAVYTFLKSRPVVKSTGITSDHIIEISRKDFSLRLRRIGYRDPETGIHYVYMSNNFKLSAKTIANIYKERWAIELFFKEIKQNLKIKRFVGTSENAVLIQIYTALTMYLLLAYMKFTSKIGISVQKIFQLIQLNLQGFLTLSELLEPRPKKDHPLTELPLFSIHF